MSLLPQQILPETNPIGTVGPQGTVQIDHNWWLLLYNLCQQVLGIGGSSPANVLPLLDEIITQDALSSQAIGLQIYPITAAEIAASVTPNNYAYPECDVRRYGATTADTAGSINTPAIQNAINVAQKSAPARVLIPASYIISSTLKVTSGLIQISGVGRGVSGLTCNTSGIGDVILVNNPGGEIFGVQIQDLSVNCKAGLLSPPNGITFKDASECYVERCFSGNHLYGIKLNGVNILRITDFESGGSSSAGVYLTINGTAIFSSNQTVWMDNLNLFNTSTAGVLIGGFSNDIQLWRSWVESNPYAVLCQNDAGVNSYVDRVLLNGVISWNSTGDSFTGTALFGALPPSGSANYLQVNNTVIDDCISYQNKTSSYHIQLKQNGNTNGNTGFFNTQIRDGEFYSASTAVVFSDATVCTGDIRGNVVALNGFQTGSAIALRAGSGIAGWATEESGTFTPSDASGASLTFTNVYGSWVRKGLMVTATFTLQYPSTANASNAAIGGLPYKAITTTNGVFGAPATTSSSAASVAGIVLSNNTVIDLYQQNSANTQLTNSQMGGNLLRMTVTYQSQ